MVAMVLADETAVVALKVIAAEGIVALKAHMLGTIGVLYILVGGVTVTENGVKIAPSGIVYHGLVLGGSIEAVFIHYLALLSMDYITRSLLAAIEIIDVEQVRTSVEGMVPSITVSKVNKLCTGDGASIPI